MLDLIVSSELWLSVEPNIEILKEDGVKSQKSLVSLKSLVPFSLYKFVDTEALLSPLPPCLDSYFVLLPGH